MVGMHEMCTFVCVASYNAECLQVYLTLKHKAYMMGEYVETSTFIVVCLLVWKLLTPSTSKSRLKSGNACYHLVQNLLSSSLLSKNLEIEIYRTIILPALLYGCETWLLTLKEERRLRVFENRVLRRIFGHKRGEVTKKRWKLHNEALHDMYSPPTIVRVIK
jgi:hypothetical protein